MTFEVNVSNSDGVDSNVDLPKTLIKETAFGFDKKALAHFMKINPEKQYTGNWNILV